MKHYALKREFEKAAVLRDQISDLKYLSQRIDLDFGDTELEYNQIKNERYLAGIEEILKKLGIEFDYNNLKKIRIECYDISNISGKNAYGSMVVSTGPKLDKSQYRIFKIKAVAKPDDPAMMKEVIKRRIAYFKRKKKNLSESLFKKPDIILIDGAKSQLNQVKKSFPKDIGLVGISKGKHLKRAGQKQIDEFWLVKREPSFDPNQTKSTKIRKAKIQNPYLFQLLRDEAHRFAIKHHRQNRSYYQKKSILDQIPGVGKKRKKYLMRKFGTISKIRKASIKQINEIVKNRKVAKRIKQKL